MSEPKIKQWMLDASREINDKFVDEVIPFDPIAATIARHAPATPTADAEAVTELRKLVTSFRQRAINFLGTTGAFADSAYVECADDLEDALARLARERGDATHARG